jgi:hypothetical protein
MAEGFFSRWSQRKEAVRKGKELAEEPAPVVARGSSPQPSPQGGERAGLPLPLAGESGGEGPTAPEPPPTLEDAQALTKDSDFSRFVRPGVAPEVKTAAFKKLFSDPHFNVMDGLDVYIDDYGKPDPLPPEMLRKMVSARFLKLFDDEEDEEAGESPTAGASPDAALPESVAQSGSRTVQALPPAEDHADPDLRLQQDDAPGPEGPGAGPR